jgi:rhamnopyranosyl-N-acetylglucosaminyl-diphospho-decaprenol beta-1,3/1,4-galactofuranosyltransferase
MLGGIFAMTQKNVPTVCAVTVAYKNPEELACLLKSLACQTRPIDGLIIIDNSEETAFIDSNKKIFNSLLLEVPYREYIVTDKNMGSAHGFKAGMELSYFRGFDWVWLLDQDGTADHECLEHICEFSREAAVLCPKVISLENQKDELGFRGRINCWGGFYPVFAAGSSRKRIPITMFATHGVMISRTAISETGYYDDRNFFCGWEDIDYSHRLKKNGIKMCLIPDAAVYHPDMSVKYKTGLIHWTSRLYMFLNSYLPLPAFLGTVSKIGKSTELGIIRNKTRVALTKKHLRGFRFWIALFFSFFCLVMMKAIGRPVLFLDSLKMYADMAHD